MEINCKIGTHSSTVVRVKGKRKLPEKGERITGMTLEKYNSLGYARKFNWERYYVDDYWEENGHRFYYLSL